MTFTEDGEEEMQEDPYEGIPAKVFGYPRLDPKEGVEYCGSAEMYMAAIGLFVKSVDEKAALLEQCINDGDTGLYTITVHAIKSSSLSIGMEKFSNQARALELAGKDEDLEKIRRDTPDFLQTYLYYKKELESLLSS